MNNFFENFLIIDWNEMFFHLNIAYTNVLLGVLTGNDSFILNTLVWAGNLPYEVVIDFHTFNV
jgi:hypothetical protein